MTYAFQHCLPTYYRCVATKREGGVPAEQLYFSYSQIEVSYRTRSADNKTGTTERVGYDVITAKHLVVATLFNAQPLARAITEAIDGVIVDHADRLHIRITNSTANEFKPPPRQRLA